MNPVARLFDLAAGRPLPEEADGSASRLQLAVHATLASIGLAAIYGLAAGSADTATLVANLYRAPMVTVLSAASALPAALLTWKLTGAPGRASDLVLGAASGIFTGTLLLAALSPLVVLFYQTSLYAGLFAMAVTALATLLGLLTAVRAVLNRVPAGKSLLAAALPTGVLAFVQLAALAQLIQVVGGLLPERTVFDAGIDGIVGVE
ncbi:MAG: hypothetical protein ACOZNI_05095 [Myxococcota bacterium]